MLKLVWALVVIVLITYVNAYARSHFLIDDLENVADTITGAQSKVITTVTGSKKLGTAWGKFGDIRKDVLLNGGQGTITKVAGTVQGWEGDALAKATGSKSLGAAYKSAGAMTTQGVLMALPTSRVAKGLQLASAVGTGIGLGGSSGMQGGGSFGSMGGMGGMSGGMGGMGGRTGGMQSMGGSSFGGMPGRMGMNGMLRGRMSGGGFGSMGGRTGGMQGMGGRMPGGFQMNRMSSKMGRMSGNFKGHMNGHFNKNQKMPNMSKSMGSGRSGHIMGRSLASMSSNRRIGRF
jgi:hypothetical protein